MLNHTNARVPEHNLGKLYNLFGNHCKIEFKCCTKKQVLKQDFIYVNNYGSASKHISKRL